MTLRIRGTFYVGQDNSQAFQIVVNFNIPSYADMDPEISMDLRNNKVELHCFCFRTQLKVHVLSPPFASRVCDADAFKTRFMESTRFPHSKACLGIHMNFLSWK